MDNEYLICHKIGLYINDIYKSNENANVNHNPKSIDIFYYVLGWHVKESYNDIYNILKEQLI